MAQAGEKPLILVHILRQLASQRRTTIVFTTSLESTHRLFRLLQLFNLGFAKGSSAFSNSDPAPSVGPHSGEHMGQQQELGPLGSLHEFSSSLSQAGRAAVIEDLRSQQVFIKVEVTPNDQTTTQSQYVNYLVLTI